MSLQKRKSLVIGKPVASSNTDQNASKALGVLYTGYLEKKNPYKNSYGRRFVVLTHDTIHWFIREENNDLFGIERGKIPLSAVLSIRVLEEDNAECVTFELQSTDNVKRLFRASTREACNEWVSAIRSSVKSFSNQQLQQVNPRTKQKLAHNPPTEETEEQEVDVLLVSFKSDNSKVVGQKYIGTEIVLARLPEWNRMINVPDVRDGDEVIISLSNGGYVSLASDQLYLKSFNSKEFDVSVKDVQLPSSLRFQVYPDTVSINGECEDHSSDTKGKNQWGIATLTKDPKVAVSLLVSIMIVCVGCNTIRFLSIHTLLLFMISIVLAGNNIVQTIIRFPAEAKIIKRSYLLIIRSHAYTSPDAPVVNNPDEEIPQRFINGCDGDLKEAQRRWDITRHWRETEGVNNILEEPQPYFFIIKNYCPQYLCSHGKLGHVVFWERPGDFDQVQLKARGIGFAELTRHWIFVTEYQWKIVAPDSMSKSITVLDIANVKMSSLSGEPLEVLKATVAWANHHYPERSYVIFILNAPVWFSMIWKLVKNLVHENTQKKVKILSKKEILPGLLEYLDIEQIPEYYGGKLDYGGGPDNCRFKNPLVVDMNNFVKNLNERLTPEQKARQEGAKYDGSHPSLAPPGLPGDVMPDTAAVPGATKPNPVLITPAASTVAPSASFSNTPYSVTDTGNSKKR